LYIGNTPNAFLDDNQQIHLLPNPNPMIT